MKPSLLLKSGFILTIFAGVICRIYGQDVAPLNTGSPFAKGNTFLNMSNKLSFQWKNLKYDGDDDGNANDYHLNIAGTWFLKDNIGIGAAFYSSRSKDTFSDIKEISGSNVLGINAIYGQALSTTLNVYGRAEIRGGFDKYNYDSPTFPEETKHSNFGFNLEIGAPLTMGFGDGFYFTPFIAYDYNVLKDESYKDVYSELRLGSRLNISLACDEYANGCSQVRDFSEGKYDRGMSVIGGYSQIRINLGGAKYFYDLNGGFEEYGKTSVLDGLIAGEYYRYIIDNLAVGGEIRLSTSSENDKDSDNKQSSFSWMLKPTVIGNLPSDGDWNNAFAFAGFGFGTASDKSDFTGNSTKTTESRTSLFLGAGYNVYFSQSFSLVPKINYTWLASKDTDTDIKSNRNGLEAGISVRYTF